MKTLAIFALSSVLALLSCQQEPEPEAVEPKVVVITEQDAQERDPYSQQDMTANTLDTSKPVDVARQDATAPDVTPDMPTQGVSVIENAGRSVTSVGTYCGEGAATAGYEIGGMGAAKALCETACGDEAAHMCSWHELSLSLQIGARPDNGIFWYASELDSCKGWQGFSNETGAAVQFSTESDSAWTTVLSCGSAQTIACCR